MTMNSTSTLAARRLQDLYNPRDFARRDESDDAVYYETDRMVSHLDRTALETVERLIGSLIIEDNPRILDLMASWDSHLPADLQAAEVTGLGMNQNELNANPSLTSRVIHDLNADPALPFPDQSFDVVLCTVSVDYLTDPVAVFAEVGRVLAPGGLFLAVFSNRWFETKVTNIWRRAGEAERVCLVEEWILAAGGFDEPRRFASKHLPRPADDKYAHLGIPSDPVYAVFAERAGGAPGRQARPLPRLGLRLPRRDPKALAAQAVETGCCPYCGEKLKKWEVPQTPFTEWDNEFMYICMNDACPYLVGGFQEMGRQGNLGCSYRLMLNPVSNTLMPMAVPSLGTLKSGLVEDD